MRALPLMLLPFLLSAPAQAQNEAVPQTSIPSLPRSPAPTEPERQGPELDVFRDPPVSQASPSQAPVVQMPPPVIAPPVMVQPTPATPTERTRAQPRREAPTTEQRVPVDQAQPTSAPPAAEPTPEPQAAPQNEASPPPVVEAEQQPGPALAPTPPTGAQAETGGISWPWIVGGLLLLIGLLTVALRRRRSRDTLSLPAPEALEAAREAEKPAPKSVAAAKPQVARPSVPRPAPALPADRPQLALALEVSGARLSLMGATVTYALSITNAGKDEARDILVRAIIANASAPMDDLLKPFFAGEAGLPIHSVPALAPGQSVHLKSELRLDPDQIAPISAGARALLIPLLAFDARYSWGSDGTDAQGRTGRAFIVGQEQKPATERLSPFRLDLGPRQFRRPAARATALALDA